MSVGPGDVIHMKSFKHTQPGLEVSYSANRDKVAVFLLLGHAPRKEPDLFCPTQALNNLGWVANLGAVQHADKLLAALQGLLDAGAETALRGDGKPDQIEAIEAAHAALAAATGAS